MKKVKALLIIALLPILLLAQGSGTFIWTNGVPTATPCGTCAKFAVDQNTYIWYEWTGVSWKPSGERVQNISGCSAPLYVPTKNLSRIVVNGCTPIPELYYYTGTAWVKLNGGTSYTAGEGIAIDGTVIRLDTLDRLTFNTAPVLSGGVGTFRWNDTDGTLDLGLKGGNVTLQLGQEQNTLVKNADNAGLTDGAVVYLVGSDGANKTVRPALASSEATSANTFGVMTESATGGNKAFCTTFGLVRNINTSALTEGAMIYLSEATAGAMTTTRPTPPNHAVQVGWCVRSHATQGIVFVSVQNGYELGELHNVSATNPTNGQVLSYNSGLGYWEATDPSAGVTWPLLAPDGDINAPSYAFENSQQTGIFFDGSLRINTQESVGLEISTATNISGGDGSGINIQSGSGASGGGLSISSGGGTDRGGDFQMVAGSSDAGIGGGFAAQAGNGGIGGNFIMQAGNSSLAGEYGGSFLISGGDNTVADGAGGELLMRGGNCSQINGYGGAARVIGGIGGDTGGPVYVVGGNGSAQGANVEINGGNSAAGFGGTVIISGGTGISDPYNGHVEIRGNGLEIKGITTSQRDALFINPDNYRIIYNTTVNKFQGYANGVWVDLH